MPVPEKPVRIAPAELARQLEAGGDYLLLDVRTPAEFRAAHISGALLRPLGDLDPAEFLREQASGAPCIYLICESGNRARKAAEMFERAGIANCAVLEGGMAGWTAAGLETSRAKGGGLSILRQVQIAVGAVNLAGSLLAMLVDPLFALIPLLTAGGLLLAGLSGWCGLAVLLAKMPWNRLSASCSSAACKVQTEVAQ
jgi:rhodanese-related sulfurtransferase